ncbi:MAG TPA: hypothetical protein VNT20_24335 [Flavisolibacter sp.]|nr:hypothetical protein [Flavisolibacter sp.]
MRELSRLKNTDGLRFILLRLGDWVVEVRKAATAGVLSFLESRYIDNWLKQLTAIDWLLKVERVDLREIHNQIIQFILSQDFSEEFYNKIKRLDEKSRFRFFKILLGNRQLNIEQLNKIIKDKNFLVRLNLIKHLSSFDTAIQAQLIARFLRDRSAKVRLEALYASKSFSPNFDDQIFILLSDEAASIRELSRHLLKDKGIDSTALYRQRIANQQFLSGSLLGLSETGKSEDLPIFERYISEEKSKLVIACLAAINHFNIEKAKQYSLELVIHPIKRVRDKAVEILAKISMRKLWKKLEVFMQKAAMT